MATMFNVDDIKKFLKQQGYVWYGYISTGYGPKIATSQDFEDPFENNILHVTQDGEDINIAVCLTSTYFELSRPIQSRFGARRFEDVDLSTAWQKYMLENYREKYAPVLKQWCETSKNMIVRRYEQDKQKAYLQLEVVKETAQKQLLEISQVQSLLGESVDEITL